MLHRSITTIELMQIQRMFSFNKGYKDLIRDFKNDFHVDLPKATAKQFIHNRSWQEVLKWLTGDDIDTKDRDKIPQIDEKHYELLDQMLKLNKLDEMERNKDISEFVSGHYFIPHDCKYFNMPLYGEIITYKFKEPFCKCFLMDNNTHKICKIEDVYITEQFPAFLLSIIRKINESVIECKNNDDAIALSQARQLPIACYKTIDDITAQKLINIFDTPLFKKYGIAMKA